MLSHEIGPDDSGGSEGSVSPRVAGGARRPATTRPTGNASDEAFAIAGDLLEYVEHSPVCIAVIAVDNQLVRYANLAFRQLIGGDDQPVLHRALSRAFTPRGADLVTALLEEVRQSGEARRDVELELAGGGEAETGAGGHGAPIAWCFSIWPVFARPDGAADLVLEARDATAALAERRARAGVLEQLRAVNERLLMTALREQDLTERAEAANEAKSVFLQTMSHELRTPLTAIIGYEELLADGITGPVTEEQREQLARIRRSAGHLLTLIDEVLTLARVEGGHEVVQRAPVSVAELVDWAASLVAPLAAAKNLAFATRLSDPALCLDTDPVKVRQILVNLLANAIKFTDQGEVALAVQQQDGIACFEVRDTGIGIAPADQERVFDAFWQVEQTPTRLAGGSGLGLSVSRRLARLLGGDVTVESEQGRGSCFTLRVPAG